MPIKRTIVIAGLFIGILILASCGGQQPQPTPTVLPTAVPTAIPTYTQLPPTASPTTIPTSTQTPTQVSPTTIPASATPVPTNTATAVPPSQTPLPTASLTSTPEPTAIAMLINTQTGADPQDLVIANGLIWVAHPDGKIMAFSAEGQPLIIIEIERGIVAMASDGQRVWALDRDGIITQLDGSSGAVSARWTFPCQRCLFRGIHWDGRAIYISNFGENTLFRLDPNSGSIISFAAGANSPTALASNPANLYVMHQSLEASSPILTHYDHMGDFTNDLTDQGFPTAMLVEGDYLWISLREEGSGTIVLYETTPFDEIWRIDANPVNDMLVAARSLWSADFTTNTVTRRDPLTGSLQDIYQVGELPQALAYQDGFLWVLTRRDSTLTRLWIGH